MSVQQIADLRADVAALKAHFESHDVRDEDRFDVISDKVDEIKTDIKGLREENNEQHAQVCTELSALKTTLLTTQNDKPKDGYTFTKKQLWLGTIGVVAVSATLGNEGIKTAIAFAKEIGGLILSAFGISG